MNEILTQYVIAKENNWPEEDLDLIHKLLII